MNDHINEMLHWFPFAVKNYGKPDGLKQHIYSLTGLEVRDLEQVSWHQNQGVDTAVFLPKALGREKSISLPFELLHAAHILWLRTSSEQLYPSDSMVKAPLLWLSSLFPC